MAGKGGQMDRDERWDPLDENTVESIADIICDDGGTNYREGWKLPQFLRRAGWSDVPEFDGSPRKRWLVELLNERRGDRTAMEMVIRRLADQREYRDDPRQAHEVAQRVNAVLGLEGMKVERASGRPFVVRLRAAKIAPDGAAPLDLKHGLETFIRDADLCGILRSRLDEAATCRDHGAALAAIILLGSVVEGALQHIAVRYPAVAGRASSAPKDRQGKVIHPIASWKLSQLILVAHEVGWIHADARDFATVLRDYRNLVHPNEQKKLGLVPDYDTVNVCWNVVIATLNDLGSTGRD